MVSALLTYFIHIKERVFFANLIRSNKALFILEPPMSRHLVAELVNSLRGGGETQTATSVETHILNKEILKQFMLKYSSRKYHLKP